MTSFGVPSCLPLVTCLITSACMLAVSRLAMNVPSFNLGTNRSPSIRVPSTGFEASTSKDWTL